MTDRERRRALNRTRSTSWDPIAAMRLGTPAAS